MVGEVLVPDVEDSQGDICSREDIETAAYSFVRRLQTGGAYVGAQHEGPAGENTAVVESFIAREGDPDFASGSWVLGVQCSDDDWEKVTDGTFTGFSMGGSGVRTEIED